MTYNHPGTKVKKFALPALFLLFLSLSLFTINCADDPTSLGLKFLPSAETTGVRILDSFTDTLPITTYSVKYRVNTYYSKNLIVGSQGNYSSKALIKFINLPSDIAGATVRTAVLKLKYRNYYFPPVHADSLGQISFNIYKVIQNLSYTTITFDSVSSSSFGTVSQGTYTGSPAADSQEVDITLNNQLAKDWLEYAADPNYSVPNYGIVLSPNASSNVLKGFYSVWNGSAVAPQVTITYTPSGSTDTLTLNGNVSENMFLTNGDNTPPQGEFFLQAGISYDQVIKFDISKSKIPSTATINDAQVFLYEDAANSKYSTQTIYGINAAFITDSAGTVNEGFDFQTLGVTNIYTLRLIAPFQRWLNGTANHGIFIIPSNQTANLDRFAFYNENASDPAKRPRVIIKYTPRATP